MFSVKVFMKDGCDKNLAARVIAHRLKNEGFEVHEYLLETAEGLAEGAYYGIMTTPAMLVVDREDNTVTSWRGKVPGVEEVKCALLAQ